MAERGGKRPGAGRKPGAITQKSRAKAEEIASSGLTPLDFMMSIMRDEKSAADIRFEAAKAAAPYVHAKLAAIDHSGSVNLTSHEDALNELDD